MSTVEIINPVDLGPLDPERERELAKAERAIARRYIGHMPWLMIIWGLANPIVWLALWPLTLFGLLPLWAAFIIATLNMMLAYLPGHEAEHNNIAGRGHPRRWLNELVGHLTFLPIVLPFNYHRLSHLQHHAHACDPDMDPDYNTNANGWFSAIWSSLKSRQPESREAFGLRGLDQENPVVKRALIEGFYMQLGFYIILAALAWSGLALEAALLWWLPRHIGMTYLQIFLSWAPHHPMEEQGRYRDTRGWKFALGNIASAGMQYHIVHHLHPNIPLDKTPVAYREMREILIERGCRIEGL